MQTNEQHSLLHSLGQSLLLISGVVLLATTIGLSFVAQQNIGKESALVPNLAELFELLEGAPADNLDALTAKLRHIARNPDTDKLRIQLHSTLGEPLFDSGAQLPDHERGMLTLQLLNWVKYNPRPQWQRQIKFQNRSDQLLLTVTANAYSEAKEAADNLQLALGALGVLTLALYMAMRWRLIRAFAPLQTITNHLQTLESGVIGAPLLPHANTRELGIITQSINHLQQELAYQQAQQQELMNRLQDLQESERRQIADELHDELGQHLTAIQVEAATLVKKTSHDSTEYAIATSLLNNSQVLLQQLRQLLQQLRPAGLDGDDNQTRALQHGLETLVNQWNLRMKGVTVIHLHMELPEFNMPSRLSLACYRIIQEGLTNAARHAHATDIYLHIKPDANKRALIIDIKDDGVGTVTQPASLNQLPRSLRERVLSQGGTLSLTQHQPSGWFIHIQLPIYETFH